MKILLTGGGTGGHFYPIIAIAEQLNILIKDHQLLKPQMYYMSTDPYNEGLLFQNNLIFKPITSGKIRLYFSILNIIDLFKIAWGSVSAVWKMYFLYPDVVFAKGGFASFPALFAARILRIPVVIHESDTVPGRVNAWAGKFAERIAISYEDSAKFFPAGKSAHTGNPIRKEIMDPLSIGAHEFLHLDQNVPTILILGGSQGAEIINTCVIDALPELVKKYQIIHQTGKKHLHVIEETKEVVLHNNPHKDRYKPFDYLNLLSMRMAAGAAQVVISRAGSTIFEIASWKKASIIIPITKSNGDHQRQNAYAYARSGAAEVIEEKNLSPHVLAAEITRLIEDTAVRTQMEKSAEAFTQRDAAKLIAQEILAIALKNQE